MYKRQVLKGTFDIGDQGDQQHIAEKDGDAQHPFEEGPPAGDIGGNGALKQVKKHGGQEEEQ